MPYSSTAVLTGILKAIFGSSHTADFPGTLYYALFDGDPEAGGVEPDSTGNYARVAVTNNNTNFSISGAVVSNLIAIVWPTSTSGYQTGHQVLSHWAIYDNSSGGNRLLSGKIMVSGTAVTIVVNGSGLVPKIAIGDWTWTQKAA